jgi:hypothetical protein
VKILLLSCGGFADSKMLQCLWADLMLQNISRLENLAGVRKCPREAPKGLPSIIYHVLEGFSASLKGNTQYTDDLNELIAGVACALRPLTLGEIATILKWRCLDGEG